MIIRKPYAFLIKYFKLIHFILFVLLSYVSFKHLGIYSELNSYAKGNIENLFLASKNVVNILLYVALIVIIIFSTLMFFLMHEKKKPKAYYIFLSLYYIIVFGSVIYATGVFNDINVALNTQKSARAVRDIFLMINIPNYFFLVASLLRAMGFDVKKFDFSRDLLELDIDSKDDEEFEFVLGRDPYKYKRKVNTKIRELKYYYLENKYFINIVFYVISGIILVTVLLNNLFFNRTYRVNRVVKSESLVYKVESVHLTDRDKHDNIIKENSKYVIVNVKIIDVLNDNFKLNEDNVHLKIRKEKFYNKTSLRYRFADLNKVYNNDNLVKDKNIMFVFEVPKKKWMFGVRLNIFNKINNKKEENPRIYNEIKFRPKKFKRNETISTIKKFDYSNKFVKNLKINKLDVNQFRKYEYIYESCYNFNNKETCNKYMEQTLPNNQIMNHFINIKYDITLDKNSLIYNSTKNKNTYFKNILTIVDKSTKNNIPYIAHNTNDESFLWEVNKNHDLDNILIKLNLRNDIIYFEPKSQNKK